MSWAVLIMLPLAIAQAILHFNSSKETLTSIPLNVYFSFIYLALASQSLGMFLWFKVLAVGPMEKVAMVQLLQPRRVLAVVQLSRSLRLLADRGLAPQASRRSELGNPASSLPPRLGGP